MADTERPLGRGSHGASGGGAHRPVLEGAVRHRPAPGPRRCPYRGPADVPRASRPSRFRRIDPHSARSHAGRRLARLSESCRPRGELAGRAPSSPRACRGVAGMKEETTPGSGGTGMRRAVKRLALAAAMAVVTLNVWTGAPLFALWVGSRVQSHSQASMTGIAVVAIVLAIVCFLLLRLLRVLGARYDSVVGASPTVRSHVSWLRSMRGERPEYDGVAPTVTMAERIAITAVVLPVAALLVWVFFFLTSALDSPSGLGEGPSVQLEYLTCAAWIHSLCRSS